MIQVDYSNEGSIQHALTGVDVVISTISGAAVDIQVKIAAAAKNAGIKLFVPSEFGGITDGETEGVWGAKRRCSEPAEGSGYAVRGFLHWPVRRLCLGAVRLYIHLWLFSSG